MYRAALMRSSNLLLLLHHYLKVAASESLLLLSGSKETEGVPSMQVLSKDMVLVKYGHAGA